MWEKIKTIWSESFTKYKAEWKACWETYKTVIIPFVEGCFAYVWQLVVGGLEFVSRGVYGTGKLILEYVIDKIKRA